MKEFKKMLNTAVFKENPTFVSFLALCPTLGTTSTVSTAIGMGVSVIFVLVLSNLFVSLVRNFIPDAIRIPAYITIIATVVTVLEILLKTYVPSLYGTLGLFLPLIVVNCIILGRAEVFASKNKPWLSILDGLTVGIAFTLSLTLIGVTRELLGTGSINLLGFNLMLFPSEFMPVLFTEASGAFLAFGILAWVINEIKLNKAKALNKGGDK